MYNRRVLIKSYSRNGRKVKAHYRIVHSKYLPWNRAKTGAFIGGAGLGGLGLLGGGFKGAAIGTAVGTGIGAVSGAISGAYHRRKILKG